MTDREKIAARIRALRAKTVENGCTEDEAIAAAEMLAKLLDKYNMTMDEAELRESPFSRHTERHEDWVGERLWKIADAVAYLTEARYWVSKPGVYPIEVNFFGFAHEVEVARYMLEICADAMRREQQRMVDQCEAGGIWVQRKQRARVAPFLDGMADRLHSRINALKPPKPAGTGLVVLHGTLIEQALKDAGIGIKNGRARGSRNLDAGYLEGLAAGDRVALNRGLNGTGSAAALLK